MSFSLTTTPTLRLTYSAPTLKVDKLKIRTAEWAGEARVKIANDHGRKWRIGFAQLLESNMMQAVYAKHTRSEVLVDGRSMPVLDSDDNPNFRPFYDDDKAHARYQPRDVQTSTTTPEVLVHLEMWDAPESEYPWWFNNDETDPIEEFVMNLKFSTYLLARDITHGSGKNGPYIMKILRQWSVLLDRRYEFTVVRKPGGGLLRADLQRSKCKIINPSRQPIVLPSLAGFPKNYAAIFAGAVANDVFVDHDTLKGRRRVGELVKSRAALWGGV